MSQAGGLLTRMFHQVDACAKMINSACEDSLVVTPPVLYLYHTTGIGFSPLEAWVSCHSICFVSFECTATALWTKQRTGCAQGNNPRACTNLLVSCETGIEFMVRCLQERVQKSPPAPENFVNYAKYTNPKNTLAYFINPKPDIPRFFSTVPEEVFWVFTPEDRVHRNTKHVKPVRTSRASLQ